MPRFLWMVGLLVACKRPAEETTCASFDETRVTNPDGRAPSGEFTDTIGFTEWLIEDFASKTTRDGVCVDEVRLVDWPDDAESWTLPGWFGEGRIELPYGEDAMEVFPQTVAHELCHAFDHAEGWMSLDAEAEFGLDAMEEFAEACATGPRPVAIDEAVEAACNIDLGTVQQRFVNEAVYDAVDLHESAADGTVTMALDRIAVSGTDADASRSRAVAGGSTLYLVEWRHSDDASAPKVYTVDPASGTAEATWELPGVDADLLVVPASDGPPVLFARDAGIWRLGPDGTVTAVDIPSLFHLSSGLRIGDDAWLLGAMFSDGSVVPFLRMDLTTGDWTEVPLPDGLYQFGPLSMEAGHLVGPGQTVDDTDLWVSFDPADETWTTTPLPSGFDGWAPLADGRLVATWSDALDASGTPRAGLATIDLDAGTWQLADDPCDTTAIDDSSTLVSIDGTAWLWEYAADGGGHTLGRIDVD